MPNNRYPKQCYLMLKYLDEKNKHTYAFEVRKLLFSYGYGFIWLSQDIGDINSFIKEFRIRVKDIMQQDWHNSLISSSKANLYSQYKSLLNVESYISLNFPFHLRQAFAKFRCSDHKLNIEVGRHYNILREERICSFCLENSSISVIEDEFHVFFHCKKYDYYRTIYLGHNYICNTERFILFMASKQEFLLLNICKFVHKILEINKNSM